MISAPSASPQGLRPYQTDTVARVAAEVAAGRRRVLLVAPTGSGKTVIAASIIAGAVARGERVLFLAHRRELTAQTCAKLWAVGIDAGIVQAGFPARPGERVQVAGVLAEHLDGSTPIADRDAMLARLVSGTTEIITNCAVLTEGWDQPEVSCLVLGRPTKSVGLYRQMVGRVLRPVPGKTDALILDHAGAVFEHGFVEEPVIWTLAEDRRAEHPAQAARNRQQAPTLTTCPECHAVRMQGRPCSSCGWRPRPKAVAVDVADGELGEVDRQRHAREHTWNGADKMRFHQQLFYIARERGYQPGWASHKYRAKFGTWPASRFVAPVPPDDAVRAWVRSQQIAYAKAMQKAGAP
jgi:ribosomal protein L32